MDPEQAGKLLAQTQLFGDLDDQARTKLASRATRRRYSRRQLIFHQGDLAGSLFVMVEGLAKVYVTSEDGDEMVLVTLRPPDVVGEISLLDGGPRSASAEALEDSVVLEIGREPFLLALHESAAMTESVLTSMTKILRRLTEQAADLIFLDLHGRVAKFLVGIFDSEAEEDAPIELDLQVTQSDLARMVGGSRQSVNQILRTFERRGFIEVRGRKMVVKEPAALRRRAGL